MPDIAAPAVLRQRGDARLSPLVLALACIAVALLTAAPFLLVTIPPLVDAPGHLGQLTIQAAPPGSMLRRFYEFHWALRLNLGTDLLVELLRRPLGLTRAFWLVSASIPALTAAATLALAAVTTRRGAAGTGWALVFAYAWPFVYGFLNFMLAMSLAILAFAGWLALEKRRGLRAAIFWPLIPVLMIAHAVGGGLLVVFIVAWTAGVHADAAGLAHPFRLRLRHLKAIAADAWPVTAALPVVLIWKLTDTGAHPPIDYDFPGKLQSIAMALRDQDRYLDAGSVAAILLLLICGHWLGARYSRPARWLLGSLLLLYIAIPSQLSGASFMDMRLVPAMAIMALVLQDWSGAPVARIRLVAAAGAALFLVRLGVTAHSFAGYQRSYAGELQALPHIRPGSRVLTLLTRRCFGWRNWRGARLDHLATMATVERASWTNSLWDVGSIHLIEIRFRPSPHFYNDPSHYVWPDECVRNRKPPRTYEQWRTRRRTIDQVLPELPLDRVDYLWLLSTRLPQSPETARLVPVWSKGDSTLYRVTPAARPPAA